MVEKENKLKSSHKHFTAAQYYAPSVEQADGQKSKVMSLLLKRHVAGWFENV